MRACLIRRFASQANPLAAVKDRGLLKTGSYINGKWCDLCLFSLFPILIFFSILLFRIDSSKTFAVTDPATGAELSQVALLGQAEAKEAVESAERSFLSWKAKSGRERGALLMEWYRQLTTHTEDLARIMTAEQVREKSKDFILFRFWLIFFLKRANRWRRREEKWPMRHRFWSGLQRRENG